jgi:hypothetical protein
MGHGRWEETGRAFYNTTSHLARKAKRTEDYFVSTRVTDELNVAKLKGGIRESRDSDKNPESNAIILGLDVTGSMGDIAHQIAKDGLGKIIEGILEQLPVTDPHILFSAIGDVNYDSTPLQASQFEADHRIIEQLNQIYVEGGGGGNNTESYDLPWYFAANMTSIDCFEKRNKKGYLFTFGDERPPRGVDDRQLKAVFDKSNQRGFTADEALKAASEKYHVFHVIIEEGWYASNHSNVTNDWKQLMGNRALPLDNYHHLPELVLAAMHVSEGASVDEIIATQQDKMVKKSLRRAFGV